MAPIALFSKSRACFRLKNFKSISTFGHLHQEAELADPQAAPPPLPPNPATGSPRYNENWRSPIPASAGDGALIPVGLGVLQHTHSPMQILSQSLDAESLMNQFASWMTTQRWEDVKQLFEIWIRSLDKNGKLNKPDVNLYNQYLRANLMTGVASEELLDLLTQMEDFLIVPNTASYNIVLKAMQRDKEVLAAGKLIERLDFFCKYCNSEKLTSCC